MTSPLFKLAAAASFLGLVGYGSMPVLANTPNAKRFVVMHPAAPAPTYIDLGAPGDSVGDIRIWHFMGTTGQGSPVTIDWIMTTTASNADGIDSRISNATFSFKGSDKDQITLQGVGIYSNKSNTFKPESLKRAIGGGTGKFTGVMGQVNSIHLPDGSWQHVFKLAP